MDWIGLDLGTTHCKAVVYDDATASIVARAARRTPVREDADGASRDPDEALETVRALLRTLAPEIQEHRGTIGGLAITGVGEEIVPVDADGRATAPIIAWYDPRGAREAAALFEPGRRPPLLERFPPHPLFSLFKLAWMRAACPEAFDRCTVLLDLAGFVLTHLGAPPAMDWSHASRTGLFEPVTCTWDSETVAAAGLDAAWFPSLLPSGTRIGQLDEAIAADVGLPPAIPLVTGGHDHFCGAFASGVTGRGALYLSAGTSEAQLLLTDGPLEAGEGNAFDQGRFVDDTHWYVHGNTPAGHAYRQWRELLFPSDDEDAVRAEVAAAVAADRGLTFEPGGPGGRSRLDGVPVNADRATIMRAVVEGGAVASARLTRALSAAVGDAVERVVVSGHATGDPLWRSLRGGMLGRPLEIVDEPEAAAVGAALLARRGVTGRNDVPALAGRSVWTPGPQDLERGRRVEAAYATTATVPEAGI